MEDFLKIGYHKSPLSCNNSDWLVDEVMKLGKKMAFCFKNTKKDIIMTEKDEEDFEIINLCRFCEKEIIDNKDRNHCHLTGKYKGPAHSICNFNVTQKQSNFILSIFHKFSDYGCHMFFKN